MQALAQVINKIFSDPELKAFYDESKVITKFSSIVGKRIAEVTEPYAYKNGVLFVKVLSAPWRHQLTMMSVRIQEQLNHELGGIKVSKIVFR